VLADDQSAEPRAATTNAWRRAKSRSSAISHTAVFRGWAVFRAA
jgi:hypothetical protein